MAFVFTFADTLQELRLVADYAGKYLDPVSRGQLERALSTLETIRSAQPGSRHRWQIRESAPIRTKTSVGQYQPDDMGEINVYALLSFIWEVVPIGPRDNASLATRRFRLDGLASVRVRLVKVDPSTERDVAEWRMEIGDDGAPGACLHVQVGSKESVWPHDIEVPRLPGFLPTPGLVLDFVLGELFQEAWARHSGQSTYAARTWSSLQKKRLQAQLRWQQRCLDGSKGSPLVSLKRLKAAEDVFVD